MTVYERLRRAVTRMVNAGYSAEKSTANYHLPRIYRQRKQYVHWDDLPFKDESQLEVYLYALGLMKKHRLSSVLDIGCGSAYKLMTYLGDYETTGIELPQNLPFLHETYPDRHWLASDFTDGGDFSADLVICSDIIEHLLDPNQLLTFVQTISFKHLLISTPCRELGYPFWIRAYWGPPPHEPHVREWTFDEFGAYVGAFFEIADHRITNVGQRTQMIVCHSRKG